MLPVQACLCLTALVWLSLFGGKSQARYLLPTRAKVTLGPAVQALDMAPEFDISHENRKSCDQRKPFLCPNRNTPAEGAGVTKNECIPLEYLCDGTPDCPAYPGVPAGFDESSSVCSALGRRLPPDEGDNFLRFLVTDNVGQTTRKIIGARLIKRSGISDQILAEIQMNRALRKQIERAKLAALNGSKTESTTTD